MAVSQTLSVTEVAGSSSIDNNTSKVRILWQSTQTGESWNGYTRTAKYYISINGEAETAYSVSYTLPKASVKTIVDRTITVTHKSDGSGSVRVRTWMDTDISAGVVELNKSLTLTTIPRASTISGVTAATLGGFCTVKWTPKSKAMRYKLKFSLGDWSKTTGAIHPNTTSSYGYKYKVPLEVAEQFPTATSGKMTVTLYTYSDSSATNQVGSASSATATVSVPTDGTMNPKVSLGIEPISSLSGTLASLYIQGKTKVKGTITAELQYGATIKSIRMKVDGRNYYEADNYTSKELTVSGSTSVVAYVTDSRGFTGTMSIPITVYAYGKPKLMPADGENTVVAARCDADGNLSENGTYLKIKCKTSYYPIKPVAIALNTCKIQYRYKETTASAYSAWTNIVTTTASSYNLVSGALLGGELVLNKSYMVQVRVVDTVGGNSYTTINVPTATVYCHRDGERNSFTFGGYVEEDNTFAIAEGIQFKVKSEKWVSLGLSTEVQDSESNFGRAANTGCHYRVVNGNHVYVAFNCKVDYAGSPITVSGSAIPAQYRPARNAYALCTTNSRGVARVFVNSSGEVRIDHVQNMASGETTDAYTVNWIDGYIDYFV